MKKIDSVTARAALPARRAPYFQKLRSECHLGFSKLTPQSIGSWKVRRRLPDGRYETFSLGNLDEYPAHQRYDVAVERARKWLEQNAGVGPSASLSVKDACERYIAKQRMEGRQAGADDAAGRFRRHIYSDTRLSDTDIRKLTAGELSAWKSKLTSSPAILQDKNKVATKMRAASTVNREMAVLKAALNLAKNDGYVPTDAAWQMQLKPLKDASRRRELYLNAEQRRALAECSPPDLADFIRLMNQLPVRPGALASAVIGDLNTSRGDFVISKDKAGQGRRLLLPNSTLKFMKSLAGDRDPGDPLLARIDGKPWNKDAWKYPVKAAALAAGLPENVTMYTLRHSIITDLLSIHDLDAMTVAKLAGTSMQMIDKHYGHLRNEHAKRGLAALAATTN